MRLGVHLRIASGLLEALDVAQELECEAIQIFSGNPNSWSSIPLNPELANKFAEKVRNLGIYPVVLHTPYLLNLASPDDDIWNKSRNALSDAVRKASMIGSDRVVTHIGSHKGEGYEKGIARICEAVKSSLDAAEGVAIALELGSGSGNSIGSTFEEIADIMRCLPDLPDRIGIGIDTAHLWGAGYDISSEQGVNNMFESLKQNVGFDRLKVVHLNDSQMLLNSKRDRHYHIGQGNIGLEGFRAILNYQGLEDLPGIIETPGEDKVECDRKNLSVLRKLIK